ncbi:hemerythrin domain-containing protein [Azospira restricta]|uniref:Hemerythrin domain-containing protein n=1 Tax=Azospira restricta TaxID=404405 RepID=A0A974Y4T1_9RHOO|nr:hemerythrin domain-containing protein [Azospira restricta]QRJ64788.1 hemerythrin domain-containing protein [Azospira restricta]
MFLFDLLFGKRDAAPAATVEAPAAAVREESAAPGTSIRFHPELIGKLTADHQLLLSLFGETSAAAARGDVAAAAARLEEFRVALQSHLLTENIRLYVYLEHALADDAASHALIHDFRHEMDGIGRVVVGFLGKYRDLAAHPERAAAFAEELAGIGKVLVERVRREEETLYPLYAG